MTNMTALSARIGRDTLDALLTSWIDGKPDGTASEAVEQAVAAHLLALVATGTVRRYDDLPNRRMNLVHDWNGMFDADTEASNRAAQAVARRFAHHLVIIHLAYLGYDARNRGADREAGLDAAIAKIDGGDARWVHIGNREHDFVSGEEFDYEIVGWNLVIGRRGNAREGLQPIDDLPPQTLHRMEIDLPTGHLLLADWLSTGDMSDGFTEMVDEGNPWRGGSQAENERDAERYLRDHGFVSVASARRCLSVLTDGSCVTVGHYDEDGEHPLPDGFRLLRGLLVIDLRKVSIAERAMLVSLYSRIHDAQHAEGLVSTIEADHDTVRITVDPGRYRVVSSGRGYIEDLLEEGHPLKVPGYEPVMILEKV
jgi:hypothetical protein